MSLKQEIESLATSEEQKTKQQMNKEPTDKKQASETQQEEPEQKQKPSLEQPTSSTSGAFSSIASPSPKQKLPTTQDLPFLEFNDIKNAPIREDSNPVSPFNVENKDQDDEEQDESFSMSTGSFSIKPPSDESVFNRIKKFEDASEVDLPLEPEPEVQHVRKITGIGSILDKKYRIVQKIAEGGMGIVYGAIHIKLEKRVAIKVLAPGILADREAHKRFIREAKASTLLTNPHTVRIYDYNISLWGEPYLVMEYVSGLNLRQALKREKIFDLERAIRTTKQVAQSLMEAHEHGLVHRDLKPSNIMLMDVKGLNEFVKIFDFGVVKFASSQNNDEDLTKQGMMLGTPRYMAPEQIYSPNKVSCAADIYSLGLIFFHMFAGQKPFAEYAADDVLTQKLKGAENEFPPDIDIPKKVRDFYRRMTAKEPEDRPSAAEVVRELDALETEIKMSTLSGRSPAPILPSTFADKSKWYVLLFVLLLVGVGVWFVLQPTDKTTPPKKSITTKTSKTNKPKQPLAVVPLKKKKEEPKSQPKQPTKKAVTRKLPLQLPAPRIRKQKKPKVRPKTRKRTRRKTRRNYQKQSVRIISVPSRAKVYQYKGTRLKFMGRTPLNIKKRSYETLILRIKKRGYFSKKLVLPKNGRKRSYQLRLKEINIELP